MAQKIISTKQRMEYIDAFMAMKDKGGLPSNAIHDENLKNPTLLEALLGSSYYSAWAREIIAYPPKYGVFEKGDFKDSDYDWVLEAKYIPKEAIGKKGIALVIDPKDLVVANGVTKIIPKSVHIQSFPQTDGLYDFDEKTKIPIDKPPRGNDYWDARRLWRWGTQTLRPLVRYYGGFVDGRRIVGTCYGPGVLRGVGWVEDDLSQEKAQPKSLKKKVTHAV